MVGLLKRGNSLDRLLHGRTKSPTALYESMSCHQSRSLILDPVSRNSISGDNQMTLRSHGGRSSGQPLDGQQIGWAFDRSDRVPKSRLGGGRESSHHSEMELMKEKFAKLLLGEDMSGGGKGVSSALALSNAITNLAASVFSEQRRLEPMSPERKARWKKEIDWFLSVSDHIVEFVPSRQISKDGTQMEIMTTQQRTDLLMNIPALRKLDAMLIDYLDNFKDQNEFWYVSKEADESEKGNAQRNDDKWWLPTVKVPPDGLSDVSRKWLLFQKESVNQVLKAAMAINAQVLLEMEIPENYIETLPKNGRACLGDAIYKSITMDTFDADQFLSGLDLSTEHKILDLKNRIEASVVIWKRKMSNKDSKSSWSSTVSLEKRELFEERAEIILVLLKHRFPGIPQSILDISKIQYNNDVGHSVLEGYSRILESLAYTVMSQIEDVLYADSLAQNPSLADSKRKPLSDTVHLTGPVKFPKPEEEIEKLNAMETPASMTLSDFIGWQLDMENQESEMKKKIESFDTNFNDMKLSKPHKIITTKMPSYIDNLVGSRSPTARH